MVYNIFNMQNSIFQCFVEDFSTNVHKGFWFLFSCSVFVWLWCQGKAGFRMSQGVPPTLQFVVFFFYSSVFWKSLRRIDISSSLNFWQRTFLVVQWLKLCTPNAGGMASISCRGTKDPTCHMVWPKKKIWQHSPVKPLGLLFVGRFLNISSISINFKSIQTFYFFAI